jgi:enoyl-CoA hydratase/carnithine racemase
MANSKDGAIQASQEKLTAREFDVTDFIRLERQEFIATLTIERPSLRNALSSEVVLQLSNALKIMRDDDKLRALIITGSQEQAFSAGADLKERQEMTEQEALAFVEKIQRTYQSVAELPMPTIAAINGDAFGGGLELALACDIRVISEHAVVGLTECGWGIIPGAGGTQRLPRLIGLARAMDLIFQGKRIDSSEALAIGLVNYRAKNAREAALHIASKIASNAPLAIRAAKEALMLSQERSLRDGLIAELASYHEIIDTDDRREGLKAFQEKRAPRFLGS